MGGIVGIGLDGFYIDQEVDILIIKPRGENSACHAWFVKYPEAGPCFTPIATR